MPYINEQDRETLDKLMKPISEYFSRAGDDVIYDGQMNYAITKLLLDFYGGSGVLGKGNRGYQGLDCDPASINLRL